jgi:hypothetical protein
VQLLGFEACRLALYFAHSSVWIAGTLVLVCLGQSSGSGVDGQSMSALASAAASSCWWLMFLHATGFRSIGAAGAPLPWSHPRRGRCTRA